MTLPDAKAAFERLSKVLEQLASSQPAAFSTSDEAFLVGVSAGLSMVASNQRRGKALLAWRMLVVAALLLLGGVLGAAFAMLAALRGSQVQQRYS